MRNGWSFVEDAAGSKEQSNVVGLPPKLFSVRAMGRNGRSEVNDP
jgi:hypothetical protein